MDDAVADGLAGTNLVLTNESGDDADDAPVAA